MSWLITLLTLYVVLQIAASLLGQGKAFFELTRHVVSYGFQWGGKLLVWLIQALGRVLTFILQLLVGLFRLIWQNLFH